ncbi:MAG: Pvc16 family protein [Silvibacterium sp.]
MSNYLAVGGVSAVLMSLLNNALTQGGPTTILGGSKAITNQAPDLITTGDNETPLINLFMYYASINPALRNLDLPSMSSDRTRLSNPPLPLNLHYLITAYGSNLFDAEILLGWAMQVFHETPVVPRAVIAEAISDLTLIAQPTAEEQLVATSDLANQIEHIRITPETLTTEEIYRLWGAFLTHYRPTTSYQVSVAVIQDTQSYKSNLPVRRRSVLGLPLISPVIENISPSMVASGQVLTINGNNFLGDSAAETKVSFDDAAPVAAATVQGTCVRVVVPATLEAGVRSVRVIRQVMFATSTKPHSGFSSNPTPLQLIPVIQPPPLPALPPIKANQGQPLLLTLAPAVGAMQTVVVYIGDQAIPVSSRPVTGPPSSTGITVDVPATAALGIYPLRVEVDGAQSKLTLDTNPASPTYNQWLPQVEVSA